MTNASDAHFVPNENRDQHSSQMRKPVFWILGLIVAMGVMVGIAAYAISITPPISMLAPLYWAGAIIFAIFGWVWLGVEAIPGKRKRSRNAFHSWTVVGIVLMLGGFMSSIPSIASFAYGFFPAFLLSMTARIGWNYGFNARIRFCVRCGAYRWFLHMNGEWYCNKKGHKWNDATSKLAEISTS